METKTVDRQFLRLERCDFNKRTKVLTTSSEVFLGFPEEILVTSHHTGRKVLFKQLAYDDPLMDEDGWDGELALYRPTSPCNVDHLVVYHAY